MSAMSKGKRLLLIDGHSMAYRAFFALPAENFTTAQGQHTNAIYGFATMLISLLKDEKPTHVAVAFDVSRKTFTNLLKVLGLINSRSKVTRPMTSSPL